MNLIFGESLILFHEFKLTCRTKAERFHVSTWNICAWVSISNIYVYDNVNLRCTEDPVPLPVKVSKMTRFWCLLTLPYLAATTYPCGCTFVRISLYIHNYANMLFNRCENNEPNKKIMTALHIAMFPKRHPTWEPLCRFPKKTPTPVPFPLPPGSWKDLISVPTGRWWALPNMAWKKCVHINMACQHPTQLWRNINLLQAVL